MDAIQRITLRQGSVYGAVVRILQLRFLAGLIVLASCAGTAHAPRVPNPEPLTDRQIFRAGLDALVKVAVFHTTKDGDYEIAYGSGSYVGRGANSQQVILTAAHLFNLEDDPQVAHILVRVSEDVPDEAPSESSLGWLLEINQKSDLALISIVKDLPRKPLKLGQPLRQLDPCWSVGDPAEAPVTVAKGFVDRVTYAGHDGHGLGMMTLLAWPGWSGGAVLNDHAELAGVVVAVNAVHDPMSDDEEQRVIVEEISYFVQQPAIAKILKAGKVQ